MVQLDTRQTCLCKWFQYAWLPTVSRSISHGVSLREELRISLLLPARLAPLLAGISFGVLLDAVRWSNFCKVKMCGNILPCVRWPTPERDEVPKRKTGKRTESRCAKFLAMRMHKHELAQQGYFLYPMRRGNCLSCLQRAGLYAHTITRHALFLTRIPAQGICFCHMHTCTRGICFFSHT
jgi:hypothetical protein